MRLADQNPNLLRSGDVSPLALYPTTVIDGTESREGRAGVTVAVGASIRCRSFLPLEGATASSVSVGAPLAPALAGDGALSAPPGVSTPPFYGARNVSGRIDWNCRPHRPSCRVMMNRDGTVR